MPRITRTGREYREITSHQKRSLHSLRPLNAASASSFGESPGSRASSVTIPIDGEDKIFSAVLLRDMCHCPSCVHESTRQRLYSIADVPSDVQVRTLDLDLSDPQSVQITWENDAPGFDNTHETNLPLDDLRGIINVGAPMGPFRQPLERQILWGGPNISAPDISFNHYMQNDTALYQVLKDLRIYGIAFVADIPDEEHALEKIATRIGPMKDTFYGLTWDVRTVPSAINAAYTSSDLGFHTDLLYFQDPPHIQLLHCIQSSSAGGASVFTDAFKSAAQLFDQDPKAFDILASLPVNYQYNHPNSHLYHTTKPVVELRPLCIGQKTYPTVHEYFNAWKEEQARGAPLPDLTIAQCLQKINWGPPFQAPFTLQSLSTEPSFPTLNPLEALNRKIGAWHAAAKKFNTLLHQPQNMYERLMKPGECVLFDNTRVLHARRGFEASDAREARWLKGGYVDRDPYLSKYRVLRGKSGK